MLGMLERVAALRGPVLLVLTYHRITERDGNRFYDGVISATSRSFREQVLWLRQRMRVLTLHELDKRLQSRERWNEPVALLTFDDGYRDNFDVAVPTLKELNVPATFFIPTEFLESPKLPWWDHIAYVIKQTTRRRLELHLSPCGGGDRLVVEARPQFGRRRDHGDHRCHSWRAREGRAVVS